MPPPLSPCDELRITIERLRAMLESLAVRGLRACGPEQLQQLAAASEDLEKAGAGHVAQALAELRRLIEADDRAAAAALLRAQVAVRLLERLLTLRVVREQMQMAVTVGAGTLGSDGATADEAAHVHDAE